MDDNDPPRAREILGKNLKALKKAHPHLRTDRDIEEATRGFISKSNSERISNAKAGTSVDSLEALASIFDLQPWQLLVEDLDPQRLPALTTTPLLEQIRSLVSPSPETDRSTSANYSMAEQQRAEKIGNTGRRKTPLSPALDADTLVGGKKGTRDGSRRQPAPTPKPRTRRNS